MIEHFEKRLRGSPKTLQFRRTNMFVPNYVPILSKSSLKKTISLTDLLCRPTHETGLCSIKKRQLLKSKVMKHNDHVFSKHVG